jgi:hypothetical protein
MSRNSPHLPTLQLTRYSAGKLRAALRTVSYSLFGSSTHSIHDPLLIAIMKKLQTTEAH